jgi:hypothetical protein
LIFFIEIAQHLKFVLGKYSTCRNKNNENLMIVMIIAKKAYYDERYELKH